MSPNVASLLVEGEVKFLNDRVSQDFARDSFYFRLCFLPGDATIQSDFKVFALADGLETLVAHFSERSVDGLALGIEHALFQRNVDLSLHRLEIIRQGWGNPSAVLLMGGIRWGHSLRCVGSANLLKRSELSIDCGKSVLQHAAMLGMRRGLDLTEKSGSRQQEAFALAVLLLLDWRQNLPMRVGPAVHLGLLLFYGLALPAACHVGPSTILRFTNKHDKSSDGKAELNKVT